MAIIIMNYKNKYNKYQIKNILFGGHIWNDLFEIDNPGVRKYLQTEHQNYIITTTLRISPHCLIYIEKKDKSDFSEMELEKINKCHNENAQYLPNIKNLIHLRPISIKFDRSVPWRFLDDEKINHYLEEYQKYAQQIVDCVIG